MHEEIDIEKRPASEEGNTTTALQNPPPKNTRTQIRISLIHEEVKIKKEPYVKEEIVIRKKPRTETKTVSESVTKEKVIQVIIIPMKNMIVEDENYWRSELSSLGIECKRKNELNDKEKLRALAMAIKEVYFQDYKTAYNDNHTRIDKLHFDPHHY